MEFSVGCEVPGFIFTDTFRLKQILVNVVGNAIKFTEKGEVGVEVIGLAPTPGSPSPKLTFVVSDSGIGMTEEQSKRIFGAFSQADR